MGYFNKLNTFVKEYFNILSNGDIPDFLEEYIMTDEMQRISKISMCCGTDYSNIFDNKFFYSNLDHSVGVALIVWNFTKDRKQTLAGLFHDIATPVFKHCIDFMNGDHEKQESTEELTTELIKNSKQIMALLRRDGISLEEVNDYKIYPIADNDTPRLSADRFEYNFSCGFAVEDVWKNLDDIKKTYKDVTILKNKEGKIELGFKTKEIAEKYISKIKYVWYLLYCNEDKIVMQFIADTVKKMNDRGYITKNDLYTLSEKEVIDKILNCEDKDISEKFKKFQKITKVYDSETIVEGKYCIEIKVKRRYIIPLVSDNGVVKRINEISENAKKDIEKYLNYNTSKYTYIDLNYER